MNIAQIEENVKSLLAELVSGKCEQDTFIYEQLLAHGHRKQSVSRLRSGERKMASKSNTPRHDEIIWKRHLLSIIKFNAVSSGNWVFPVN